MALLTKSGGFTTPTTAGNFDVTGLGFQPTGIIAKAVDAVITGGAFIIRVNDYINVPRIGIRPQIGGQPNIVDGRGVTDINVAKSRAGRIAERPRTSVVNTRPRARQ